MIIIAPNVFRINLLLLSYTCVGMISVFCVLGMPVYRRISSQAQILNFPVKERACK